MLRSSRSRWPQKLTIFCPPGGQRLSQAFVFLSASVRRVARMLFLRVELDRSAPGSPSRYLPDQ